VEAAQAQGDREPHVSPGQLLVDDAHQPGLGDGVHVGIVPQRSDAEGVVLVEDVPQHRPGGDHVGRVGHAVELGPGGPQHLRRELVGRVLDGAVLFGKTDLDVD
jgi:hypothetical protein